MPDSAPVLTTRRDLLSAAGAALAVAAVGSPAQAALARGLRLAELVRECTRSVVGVALAAHSEWVTLGHRRVIVTDTRLGVEESLLGEMPGQSELVVRVLGGVVGDVGVAVDGQAELARGERCVLFLTDVEPTLSFVTGAAQGHYPLSLDPRGIARLRASPRLPHLLRPEGSAVARLYGATLAEARELVRTAPP